MTTTNQQLDVEAKQKELAHWLALHQTPHIGAVTFHRLLTHYQDIESIFLAPAEELRQQARLRAQAVTQIKQPNWQQVEQALRWQEQADQHILLYSDVRYPPLLRELPDPPPLLFAHGNLELLHTPQLAIVGSRNPSPSGKENAFEFARYLSSGGLTITSGLALGIDAAAHHGALTGSGKTIAVMGTGIDRIYPASNHGLARNVAEHGLLLSELPLGFKPLASNFPRRNRIISGLSMGTLVVEAALKSGSLITARLTAEQGREVFAIPGSIHNPLSRGCHALIKQGAKLVETAEDIVEELGALLQLTEQAYSEDETEISANNLTNEQLQVLNAVDFDPISVDQIIDRSGLTADVVSSILLMLELENRVSSSGGHYSRTGHKGKS